MKTNQTKLNFSMKFRGATATQVGFGLLKGIFGSLLILLFLSGFMSVGGSVRFFPWIIGFNAALACFSLTERNFDALINKRVTAAGTGAGIALLSGVLMNILSHYVMGVLVIYWFDMMLSVFIGSIGGLLGAILAITHHKLKLK